MTSEKLSDEEARALVFVRELGAINNAAYRSINRTETLQASAHLRRLRDLGILEMRGSGSRTFYMPGEAFAVALVEGTSPQMATSESAPDPHQVDGDPHELVADPHKLAADPHKLAGDPPKLRGISAELPKQLAERINLAGTRPRKEVTRALVLQLCAWRSLTAREIAEALGKRDTRELVRTYLGPLVASGDLVYSIPEMPNHPDQKYLAAPSSSA